MARFDPGAMAKAARNYGDFVDSSAPAFGG